jgi:hypothetical protein
MRGARGVGGVRGVRNSGSRGHGLTLGLDKGSSDANVVFDVEGLLQQPHTPA